MEITQKHLQMCKAQDALKKRYASIPCVCMIHAANNSVRDRNLLKKYTPKSLNITKPPRRRRGGSRFFELCQSPINVRTPRKKK